MKHGYPSSYPQSPLATDIIRLSSRPLGREVTISLVMPADYRTSGKEYPLLLFNDGQDFPALQIAETASYLIREGVIPPLMIVGLHASEHRIYEYGVAAQADYKGRGNKAAAHTSFVIDELLPFLIQHFPVKRQRHAIAGFSLGGLMALDIAWNHPSLFSHAGVFSGSLWWRQKPFDESYDDSDRIMHRQIRETLHLPDVNFWFQTGTNDETSDRNNDGVIDSIEDTLDCIAELERKGYRWGKNVVYLEIKGGEHNPNTWKQVLPEFFRWLTS